MFNKKYLIILVLIIFITAISSVSANDSIGDMANTTCDEIVIGAPMDDSAVEVSEDCAGSDVLEMSDFEEESLESSKKGTFSELQKKIDSAKKGSTVYLTKDYSYNKKFGSTNGVKITKSLTVDGKGHKIDGLEESALLVINKADNVVLKNIIFKNGFIDNVGNIGVFDSNNVKFVNCRFESNSANSGGAVFLLHSNRFSFDSCTFVDNYAEYGGAVYFQDCQDSSFRKCLFDCNLGDYGGAVYSNNGESSFVGCKFTDNFADYGGSVYLSHSSSSFDSCTFSGNTGDCGVCVYMDGSASSFNACKFLDNFADLGGGIYSTQSSFKVTKCDFKNNFAYSGGADIFSQQGMTFLKDSSFTNVFSSVEKEDALFYNGALCFNNDYVDISNCDFVNCSSTKNGGGAIFCLNSILNSVNSRFKNNKADFGGAISSINTELVVKNNTFLKNNAKFYGGSIYLVYGSISVEDSVFSSSSAYYGSCIYIRSPHNINGISNNIFSNSLPVNTSLIYVDGYYGEIPLNKNVYESNVELCSNFGSVFDFKSENNPVPLLNPDYSSNNFYPSYYDFREDYTPLIENQWSGSNCWAFAGIATLEACLYKISVEDYDFSENNAKNLMASSSIYGWNLDSNTGGYDSMFIGYLASWLGPILEEDDWYDEYSLISLVYPSLFHIQDVSFLSPRKNSLDNNEFKNAIMNYGAVSVILNWTKDNKGFHAVSLMGWDDNYNGYDSLGNYAKGVWIFKNSWDTDWGDEGFGYLSYEQKLSGEIAPYMHAYTFIFNDSEYGYQDIYQYDFAGLTDYLRDDNDFIYYKNRFTAKDDEYLYAFSTYFEKPTYFTYSVRINGEDIVKDENNNTILNSIHYSNPGYHTISLGYNLTLKKGDEFEIVIKLVNNSQNYVPVCQADELYKSAYPDNVSFISYNGLDWIDLYSLNSNNSFAYGGNKSDTCQVACIKAFTSRWRIGQNETLDNLSSTESYKVFELHADEFIITFYDANGEVLFKLKLHADEFSRVHFDDELDVDIDIDQWDTSNEYYTNFIGGHYHNENFIEVCYNGEVHYESVDNGRVSLNFYFDKEGYYKFSAKLKSNYFTSNKIEFEYAVVDDYYYGAFSELMGIINNAEEGSVIALDKNYYFDGGFKNNSYILINKSLTIDGRGHTLSGLSKSGVFKIEPGCNVTLRNIRFKSGYSNSDFSTIFSRGNLTVYNCEFIKNRCNFEGGAIYSQGECHIINSVFNSNYAWYGGAIYVSNSTCTIDKTTFRENLAGYGGSIFVSNCSQLIIKNSNFEYDWAYYVGGSIYSSHILNVTDSKFISNQKIEVIGFQYHYDEDNTPHGELYLKNNKMTTSAAAVLYNENEVPYGESLQLIFNNIKVVRGQYVNLFKIVNEDGNTFNFVDVNVTLKNRDNPSDITNIKMTYSRVLGGYILDTSSVGYGVYKLTGSVSKLYADNCAVKDGILYVVKKSALKTYGLVKVYGTAKKLTVTLKDINGKAISKVYLSVMLNGKTFKIKTNSKGQATLAVKLSPKTYTATIVFSGNDWYSNAKITTKVVIKKAKPKITAKKKTFKRKTKTKKYRVTLKNNLGKAMKKVKVTLKVKGKTYKVKTNSKGKATFKIKNLKKKGTYKATIKYSGNKYYKSVTKKVKIKVKK